MRRLGTAFGLSGLLALALMGIVTPAAHATFPGRNGLIVFEGLQVGNHSQIFTIRPDGSHLRQLTHEPNGTLAHSPHWSPDGQRITYCVSSGSCEAQFGSPDARVWVMNWDGSDQHPVTNESAFFDVDPNWSPDGRHIVFSRCSNVFGTCDIDVMRADGTHIRKLIGGYWHHSAPAYSPDGTMIAFTSDKGGFDTRIWVVEADGSNPRAITPVRLYGGGGTWAPDGSRIFFAANSFGDKANVWTVAPDGSNLRSFTRFHSFVAGYSPNGREIVASAVSLPDCGCGGLVLVNSDGTIQRRIVTSKQVPGIGVFTVDWGTAR